MANKSKAELTTQANEIKNETQQGANTANRVGTMLNDLIDSTTTGGGVFAMDLDDLPYSIEKAGIYYVINGVTYDINLPTPDDYTGQIIYLINQIGVSANIGSTNRPYNLDGTSQTTLPNQTTFVLCSINAEWKIILQYSV